MRGSLDGLPLRAALTRGALITVANWPLVLLQFMSASVYRLALSVPVVGGVFIVAILAGGAGQADGDLRSVLSQDVRAATGLVAAALADHPGALTTFLVAVGLVALGGSLVVFLTQAGTASVLVSGEQRADATAAGPLRPSVVRMARAFDLDAFTTGVRRFGRRFLVLGAWLYVAYAVVGGLALLGFRASIAVGRPWDAAWGLGALLVLSAALTTLGAVNLVYALMQVIVVTDDCRLSQALRRLHDFARHDARQVLGVYGVMLTLVVLASAAALLAAAGLALVAWVPVVGLVVVPLQLAAWLVRGVVFHYMDLGAWSAYQTQYRRFGTSF